MGCPILSPPPEQVLDWEFLLAGIDPSLKGRSFGERLDERAAKGWAGYPGESVTGFGIVSPRAWPSCQPGRRVIWIALFLLVARDAFFEFQSWSR